MSLEPSLDALPGTGPVVLAFSGGGDSVCLLHQVHGLTQSRGLVAVHVDHGLDHGSAERAICAMELAAGLGVDCRIERVKVRRSGSLEANARQARYAALALHVPAEGVLLTAHHADDLAETMILRLLRGAGVAGLGGIPRQRRYAAGWLVRPLLSWNRAAIKRYLHEHELDWISDPANELSTLDRNFIRHEVLPLLKTRFPGAVGAINRSAELHRAALHSLNALAVEDLAEAMPSSTQVHYTTLARLDPFRRSEAVRLWCIQQGLGPPPGSRLDEFLRQAEVSAADRLPELRWGAACMRFWREWLWLDPDGHAPTDAWELDWDDKLTLPLPAPCGRLELAGPGERRSLGLSVRSGQPGERIRLHTAGGHRRVKNLMQEFGIPPWQRALWPRLYLDGRLVAVGDQWLDPDFASLLGQNRLRLRWHSDLFRPASGQGDNDGAAS